MTCSARLPVYAVIIAAFIPDTQRRAGRRPAGAGAVRALCAGIVGAMVVALVLRRSVTKGAASGFIMELPKYQLPQPKDLLIGLYQRAWIFLRRAGTIIFDGHRGAVAAAQLSRAPGGARTRSMPRSPGKIANGLAVVVEPIGFNRDIALALIPAMAAREVAVSSLATTYAVDARTRSRRRWSWATSSKARWSLPTALAFLAWFVFAPQCLSTIAVARRETNGWKWPAFMLALPVRAGLHLRRESPIGAHWPCGSVSARKRDNSWQAASTRSFWSAIWGRPGSEVVPERRTDLQPAHRHVRKLEGQEHRRDEGTDRVAPVVLQSDGLVGVAERYLQKGQQGLHRRPAAHPQVAGSSGNDRYTTEISVGGNGGVLTMLDGAPGGGGGGGQRSGGGDGAAVQRSGGRQ